MTNDQRGGTGSDEGQVPIFGTWPRIYAAVILTALAVMAGVAVFSRWPF